MIYEIILPHQNRIRTYTEPGTRYKDIYKPIFKDDGSIVLEVVDKEDTYAYIQSHKDSVDLNKLLERFQETGDMSIFNQRQQQPFYGDFLDMPKTVAEMYQRVSDVSDAFMHLKPEIRDQFNHSPSEWLASYGTPEWYSKMGLEGPKQAAEATKEKEVVQNAE